MRSATGVFNGVILGLLLWAGMLTTATLGYEYSVTKRYYQAAEPHAIALPPAAHLLPDAHFLAHQADSAGIPRALVFAVAWKESRGNVNPGLRGGHCRTLTNCEIGRFQIKPTTAAHYCDDLNVWTYRGNVQCFLRMFARDYAKGGADYALSRQIGMGLGRAWQVRYVDAVLAEAARMEWAE